MARGNGNGGSAGGKSGGESGTAPADVAGNWSPVGPPIVPIGGATPIVTSGPPPRPPQPGGGPPPGKVDPSLTPGAPPYLQGNPGVAKLLAQGFTIGEIIEGLPQSAQYAPKYGFDEFGNYSPGFVGGQRFPTWNVTPGNKQFDLGNTVPYIGVGQEWQSPLAQNVQGTRRSGNFNPYTDFAGYDPSFGTPSGVSRSIDQWADQQPFFRFRRGGALARAVRLARAKRTAKRTAKRRRK